MVTPEDSRLVHLAETLKSEHESSTWQNRKNWDLNDEYYLDNQVAHWNPYKKGIERGLAARFFFGEQQDKNSIQFNIFKSDIVTIASRLLSTRPQVVVNPGSLSETASEGAEGLQRILQNHEWRRQDIDDCLEDSVYNMLLHGDVAWRTVWNPRGGRYLGKQAKPAISKATGKPVQAVQYDQITGQLSGRTEADGLTPVWVPEVDKNGQPVVVDTWEGAIETEVFQAKNFMVDRTARRWRQVGWCGVKRQMSPQAVFDRWGVRVGFTGKRSDEDHFPGFSRGRFAEDAGNTGAVEVVEIHYRRGRLAYPDGTSKEIPNGFYFVVADGKVLARGDNSDTDGELPFSFATALPNPKSIRGDTVSNSLRLIQNTMNRTGHQIVRANDLHGDPQWMIPNQCRVPRGDRRNGPSHIWRYEEGKRGEKPTIVPGTGASATVERWFNTTRSVHQDVSGLMEGGLGGGAPAQIESGKALAVMTARDDGRLATTGLSIGRLVERWGWLTSKIIQKRWKHRRLVNVSGDLNTTEVIAFSGADIENDFTLSVLPSSVIPQSQAMKEARADKLLSIQAIDMMSYLRRIGEESSEDFTTARLESANARLENIKARKGDIIDTPPEVMWEEDDSIHMTEHHRELMNPALRRDPRRWHELLRHHNQHKENARLKAQEAAMEAATMQQMAGPPMEQPEASRQASDAIPDSSPSLAPPPGAPELQGPIVS